MIIRLEQFLGLPLLFPFFTVRRCNNHKEVGSGFSTRTINAMIRLLMFVNGFPLASPIKLI
jgi:hypothetical protein